jgi:adenylate cyclase
MRAFGCSRLMARYGLIVRGEIFSWWGAQLAGDRIERRLAAVLAADVAGYSRLMGLDEVGTARTLREHRAVSDALVAKHAGRIVKTTGDGLLLEFPSVVDAIECAVAVQTVMAQRNEGLPADRRMLFRIGINLGDILIEGDDILGDGVNVAARLEGIAEPGGICISSSAYEQVRGKVEVEFTDLGEQSLKNIDRPVRVYAAKPKSRLGTDAFGVLTSHPDAKKPLPLPDKPSIAVLPFQNMSGDPEQEYFADGMVEDIITSLSRFKSLFVIARNSCFTYKGKAVDIKQVGRELGVRYVLEGSVRKSGGRVRITGQLIDAATGAHLWADKIDGSLEDVFDLQDNVTLKVIGAIAPSILEAEIARARAKATANLDAYDLYLRALSLHYSQTSDSLDEALQLLGRAIALDPNYSWAKAFAAYIHCLRISQGWGSPKDFENGRQLAREALGSNRDDPNTIGFAAHSLAWLAREHDSALAAMDIAIQLNPNSFDILVRAGWMRVWVLDSKRAIEHFSRAMRLNPIDPLRGYAICGIAYCHIIDRDYDKALEFAQRTVREMPSWLASWTSLAIAAAYLGKDQEVRRARDSIFRIAPNYSLAVRRALTPSGSVEFDEITERGLRLAGVPDE